MFKHDLKASLMSACSDCLSLYTGTPAPAPPPPEQRGVGPQHNLINTNILLIFLKTQIKLGQGDSSRRDGRVSVLTMPHTTFN